MKLLRYRQGGTVHVGALKDDRIVPLDALGFSTMLSIIEGGQAALDKIRAHLGSSSGELAVSDAELLAPIERPGKYLAIGMNYAKHLEESDKLGVAR